jgi:predicted dehydrogenase
MVRDPGVDAVAVVTPDFAHRAPIVAAAEAGKHVISEKPLATTREDAEAIAAAVRAAGITFMVDFHARWSPPFVITRRDIEAGTLGRIVSAYVRLNDTISVPTSMLSWAGKSSILWFLGSHAVDILRYLFHDEVDRVYAVAREGVLRERGIPVPDLYQAILEFKSGITAQIESNWIVPDTNPMVNDFKVNVLGSKGMVNMDLTHHAMIERYFENRHDRPDTIVKPLIRDAHAGFAYHSIRDFTECLAFGRPVQAGLADGLAVTSVILAILESSVSRTPVAVSY